MSIEVSTEPILGRQEIINEVTDSLQALQWHGSLILAEPGMGKTSVTAAVLKAVKRQFRAFQVFASPVLSEEPYGALAPYLGTLPREQSSSPAVVMKTLAAALQLKADKCAVMVVEDAQFLDEDSALLFAQLAAVSRTKFIFLCSHFPAAPAGLWSMCSNRMIKSLELAPLPNKTMQELCQRVLGTTVFPETTSMLCRRAAGNPFYLLELINQARESGDLVEIDGVWLLVRHPMGASPRMRDSIGAQLQQLTEAARRALEFVALSGSLDLDTLYQVADRSCVDDLEKARLITLTGSTSRRVCLANPRMGEVIAELVPMARTLGIKRRLLELVDPRREGGETLLNHVIWALDEGIPVADDDALLAARLGNSLYRSDLAERAAGAVTSPELWGAARLEIAKAKLGRGDDLQFSMIIGQILARALDPDIVLQAAMLCGHAGLRHSVDSTALADLTVAWQAAVQRLEHCGALAEDSQSAAHQLGLQLLHIQKLHTQGHYLDTEQQLVQMQESVGGNKAAAIICATLLSEVQAATGRALEAIRSSSHAIELLKNDGKGLDRLFVFVLRHHLSALWHAGRIDELRRFVDVEMERQAAALIVHGGSFHLVQGLGDIGAGAMNVGLQKLSEAAAALQASDPGNDLSLGLAATAYAASALGKETVMEKYAELFEASQPSRDVVASLRSRAYLVAARGMFEGNPGTRLRRIADEAAAMGLVHVEMEVLTMGIYAGDLGVAPRLKALARTCEGEAAEYTATYAQAITERDATALLAFSDDAENDGRDLAAARSAANAVTFLTPRGDRNRLHGAQRIAKRRLARLVYGHSSLSERLNDLPKLTRRERKVAALVQGGASNRDIASDFGLSVRTVEGHLYRIYAKLGISERSEISNTESESWGV